MQKRRLIDTKPNEALRLNEVEIHIVMERIRAILALAKGRVPA